MSNTASVKARVIVYPRKEILDPQGKAIQDVLSKNGFGAVSEVRAGKSFDIELVAADAAAAREQLERMSHKILANPLIEAFEIHLEGEGAAP